MSSPLSASARLVGRRRFAAASAPKLPRTTNPSRNFAARSALNDIREPLGNIDAISRGRQEAMELAELKRKRNIAAIGLAFSVAGTFATLYLFDAWNLPPTAAGKKDKLDAGDKVFPSSSSSSSPSSSSSIPEDEKARSLRETGTSSVPFFPKTIVLPNHKPVSTATPALPAGVSLPGAPTASHNDEFSLLGLGIRTVSFLSIQVYVVGLYVATPDLPKLQAAMVRAGAEVEAASTLVATEKSALKERLLHAERGVEAWDRVLKEEGIRSAVRVVPTRGTDYAHLRDGWVRGIMARSGNAGVGYDGGRYDDDAFGHAVGEFKKMFGNKKLPKGKVLILEREKSGGLVGWEQSGAGEQELAKMGEIGDERLGRLIWMGYLAGKSVSSEGARKDVVEGVLELVERPVGTVETQVV